MLLQDSEGRPQNILKIDAVSAFSIVPWEYKRNIQPIS